jgi:hypothetical protein
MRYVLKAAIACAAVLAGAGVAAPASALGAGPAGPPRYYFEEGNAGPNVQQVIRATATGAITDHVSCPWPRSVVQGVAPASNQTFFVTCVRAVVRRNLILGTRLYRFQVTGAGRVGGYRLVRGGVFGRGLLVGSPAVTPDGSGLAVDLGSAKTGAPLGTWVINTRTGAHAVWRGSVLPGGILFQGRQLSFSRDGRDLAFFGNAKCAKKGSSCKSPGQAMVEVSAASAGGSIGKGRVVYTESAAGNPVFIYINDSFISPDGRTALATVVGGKPLSASVSVVQISARTGKQVRVLYRMSTGNGFSYRLFSVDPTGRWMLLDAGPTTGMVNGWIDRGKLIPLKPSGDNVILEAW